MLDVTRLRVIDAVARHGSVTAAAKELHYSQPSVSHHLARLEAETGAQLLQRVGRGIRLTPAGPAAGRPRGGDHRPDRRRRRGAVRPRRADRRPRAAGRLRLRDRLAGAAAAATLARKHPGLEIGLIDTHPPEALELLRTGKVEVAIIFRYDETEPEPAGVRLHHLLDDPVYLLSKRRERGIAACATRPGSPAASAAAATCSSVCADAGFDPRIGYSSDDMVVMQALVAAGLGVPPRPAWPSAPTTSRASSRPSCPARSGTSTPRPTASRPTRPPPPPSWRPSPRPPRRRSTPPVQAPDPVVKLPTVPATVPLAFVATIR